MLTKHLKYVQCQICDINLILLTSNPSDDNGMCRVVVVKCDAIVSLEKTETYILLIDVKKC